MLQGVHTILRLSQTEIVFFMSLLWVVSQNCVREDRLAIGLLWNSVLELCALGPRPANAHSILPGPTIFGDSLFYGALLCPPAHITFFLLLPR